MIRAHRLAPGASVDKNDVAAVLAGDLRHITDPVVAVARASHLIAEEPSDDADAAARTVASPGPTRCTPTSTPSAAITWRCWATG
ncbi:hypothetical protein, partial [Actinoplanes philippinensis]|uniref:hypothetical protein n=1 Tax=Actinoplanes philippinensis TaxID=35752 RepID=UPI00340CA656